MANSRSTLLWLERNGLREFYRASQFPRTPIFQAHGHGLGVHDIPLPPPLPQAVTRALDLGDPPPDSGGTRMFPYREYSQDNKVEPTSDERPPG